MAKTVWHTLRRLIGTIGTFLKRKWVLLLVLVLIIGGVGFWRYQQSQANKPKLTFEHPAYRDITKILEVSGVVDAKEKASMRFAAGGKLVYLGAQEGDVVRKGQTIATIDQRTLQKQLRQDLNAYMTERWNWDQTLDDTKDRWLPKSEERDVDQEQWALDDTVLDVEIRDIAIQNTRLSAPFDGVLVDSPTSVTGVHLLATEPFELVNPDTLIFRAAVDEADIATVRAGLKGTIVLDSYPDQPLESTVDSIAYKSSESSTGTVFVVELPILGEDLLNRYRLGMNGDVTIEVDQRSNVLTIPFIATRTRDSKVFVDVRTGEDTYEEREVTTGLETDEYVEVVNGLTVDNEIVVPEE